MFALLLILEIASARLLGSSRSSGTLKLISSFLLGYPTISILLSFLFIFIFATVYYRHYKKLQSESDVILILRSKYMNGKEHKKLIR